MSATANKKEKKGHMGAVEGKREKRVKKATASNDQFWQPKEKEGKPATKKKGKGGGGGFSNTPMISSVREGEKYGRNWPL